MKIQSGKLVELEYEILDDEGRLYETSEDEGPLLYVQGQGELPEGLERALEGQTSGFELEITFPEGEAFGDYNPDGLITVPRDEFPEDAELVKGEIVVLELEENERTGEDEDELEMRIVEVGPDGVVLDANHPLASKSVTFKVKVLDVREEQ